MKGIFVGKIVKKNLEYDIQWDKHNFSGPKPLRRKDHS